MIELGYWKIRGLVGGARVMLEHAGAGTDSYNYLWTNFSVLYGMVHFLELWRRVILGSLKIEYSDEIG